MAATYSSPVPSTRRCAMREQPAASSPKHNAFGESMDDFMSRTAHTNVPSSLRRMAWILGKPIPEVVAAYELAKEADQRAQ